MVFPDLHALIGTLRTRVVRELADWLSSPPGNERRFDGSAGADDDSAGRWEARGARLQLRRNTDSAGTTPRACARWGDSSTCVLALAVPGKRSGLLGIVLAIRFLPEDRAEARPRALDFVGFCLVSPGLVLFLYGVDHVSERIGLTAFFVALVLLTVFIRTATMKGDDALIDLQLFRRKDCRAPILTRSVRRASPEGIRRGGIPQQPIARLPSPVTTILSIHIHHKTGP